MSRPVSEPSRSVPAGLVLLVDGREVAEVELAATYLRRLRGMLGRRRLPEALLLVPGGSVHGMGMTVSLDVAQLVPATGRRRQVVGEHTVARTGLLRPFGLLGSARGVRSTLEAPAGSFARWGLEPGVTVSFRESDDR